MCVNEIHITNKGFRHAVWAVALLMCPIVSSAESRICTTSEVVYESKPAIKTECNDIQTTESRLAKAVNKRSTSFNESIKTKQRIGNMLGFTVENQKDQKKHYLRGFPDQRISYEGEQLERVYNIMMEKQYKVQPIRTQVGPNPFNE